jgi:hypothetical protein
VSDPLARYRPGASSQSTAQNGAYQAFGTKEHPARVDVRPKDGPSRAYLYTGISEITHDREGEGILLNMPGKTVKILGRNLQPIAEALIAGTCAFIEEHDASRPGPPLDGTAAIVETIAIIAAKPASEGAGRGVSDPGE